MCDSRGQAVLSKDLLIVHFENECRLTLFILEYFLQWTSRGVTVHCKASSLHQAGRIKGVKTVSGVSLHQALQRDVRCLHGKGG